MTGKEELIKELEVMDCMARENPCSMPDVAMSALAKGLRILMNQHCERGMSLEKVALYFGVSTKTIERWQKDESLEFPKPKRDGHKDLSYSTDMIVRWAKNHPDKKH